MMQDLISRQAAIDKFEPWLKVNGYSEGELNMLKAVLYELRFLPPAVNVPETNVGDTISRQAAIDAIGKVSDELYENIKKGATFPQRQWFDGMAQAQSILENLPSAQPEVIRCKDCKYWRFDHTCREHSLVSPMMANEFCSRAERRTNE